MLDVEYCRSQFPSFGIEATSKWAFLENAGGSYVPPTGERLAASMLYGVQGSTLRLIGNGDSYGVKIWIWRIAKWPS